MRIVTEIESFDSDDETPINRYILSNNSLTVTLLSYGATIVSVFAPNRHGDSEEVTLSYQSTSQLKANPGPYFGCTVGRYANRIRNGKFNLEDREYQLAVNNGGNALHGGIYGFDKKNWKGEAFQTETQCGVKFSYFSVDGEEGYPGNLNMTATYSIDTLNTLMIQFEAITDAATPINIVNHTYWNLSGNCRLPLSRHLLSLPSQFYLPTDPSQIPTGEIRHVENSPFDLRPLSLPPSPSDESPLSLALNLIGKEEEEEEGEGEGRGRRGLDHCYLVSGHSFHQRAMREREREREREIEGRGGGGVIEGGQMEREKEREDAKGGDVEVEGEDVKLNLCAVLEEGVSGRRMSVHTSQPCVQVYSANWLAPHTQPALFTSHPSFPFLMHNAVCLETQHPPDAPNQTHRGMRAPPSSVS